MSVKLFLESITKFMLGIFIIGLLIFVPADTLNYFNGWLLMILLFIPMFITGFVMIIKSPDLLKKRLSMKEQEKEQKK